MKLLRTPEERDGFSQYQTWINYYLEDLAKFHRQKLSNSLATLPDNLGGGKGKGYSRVKIVDGGAHPSQMLQKLVSFSGIYDFLGLKPYQLSQLVPMIRIYRELENTRDSGDPRRARHEIYFSNYTDSYTLQQILDKREAYGAEYGIKEFSFDDIGQHPGIGGRVFKCKLKLHSKSLQALTQVQRVVSLDDVIDDEGETVQISPAFLFNHTQGHVQDASSSGAGSHLKSKIKLRIGWSIKPNSDLERELGHGNSYLNTCLAIMTQEFELNFTKYGINFNEDGSINVDIDYIGAAIFRDPSWQTDVFSLGDYASRSQAREEQISTTEYQMGNAGGRNAALTLQSHLIGNIDDGGSPAGWTNITDSSNGLPYFKYWAHVADSGDGTNGRLNDPTDVRADRATRLGAISGDAAWAAAWDIIGSAHSLNSAANDIDYLAFSSGVANSENLTRYPLAGSHISSELKQLLEQFIYPVCKFYNDELGDPLEEFWKEVGRATKTHDGFGSREANAQIVMDREVSSDATFGGRAVSEIGDVLHGFMVAVDKEEITPEMVSATNNLITTVEEAEELARTLKTVGRQWLESGPAGISGQLATGTTTVAENICMFMRTIDESEIHAHDLVYYNSPFARGEAHHINRSPITPIISTLTKQMLQIIAITVGGYNKEALTGAHVLSAPRERAWQTVKEHHFGKHEGAYHVSQDILVRYHIKNTFAGLAHVTSHLLSAGSTIATISFLNAASDNIDYVFNQLREDGRIYAVPVSLAQWAGPTDSATTMLGKVQILDELDPTTYAQVKSAELDPDAATSVDDAISNSNEAPTLDAYLEMMGESVGDAMAELEAEQQAATAAWLSGQAEAVGANVGSDLADLTGGYVTDPSVLFPEAPDTTTVTLPDIDLSAYSALGATSYNQHGEASTDWSAYLTANGAAAGSGLGSIDPTQDSAQLAYVTQAQQFAEAYIRATPALRAQYANQFADLVRSLSENWGIEVLQTDDGSHCMVPDYPDTDFDTDPVTMSQLDSSAREQVVYFTFIGDILESLFSMTDRPPHVILGQYWLREGQMSIPIADMPISLKLFNDYWRELYRAEGAENNPVKMVDFVHGLLNLVNENLFGTVSNGTTYTRAQLVERHYTDDKNVMIPHTAGEPIDTLWSRASDNTYYRLNVGSDQFRFPTPFTNDDLDFTNVVYIYGAACELPASLAGDLDNDLLGRGFAENASSISSTGVDDYYQNFGPILHLRYGADNGIVKALDFSSINDPNVATAFALEGYDREGSEIVAGQQAAQTAADAAAAEAEAEQDRVETDDLEGETTESTLLEAAQEEDRQVVTSAFAEAGVSFDANQSAVIAPPALFNKVKARLVGNNLFSPGRYVFIDPKMPGMSAADMMNPTFAHLLGIGGYYVVVKTTGTVSSETYEIEIEGVLERKVPLPETEQDDD